MTEGVGASEIAVLVGAGSAVDVEVSDAVSASEGLVGVSLLMVSAGSSGVDDTKTAMPVIARSTE